MNARAGEERRRVERHRQRQRRRTAVGRPRAFDRRIHVRREIERLGHDRRDRPEQTDATGERVAARVVAERIEAGHVVAEIVRVHGDDDEIAARSLETRARARTRTTRSRRPDHPSPAASGRTSTASSDVRYRSCDRRTWFRVGVDSRQRFARRCVLIRSVSRSTLNVRRDRVHRSGDRARSSHRSRRRASSRRAAVALAGTDAQHVRRGVAGRAVRDRDARARDTRRRSSPVPSRQRPSRRVVRRSRRARCRSARTVRRIAAGRSRCERNVRSTMMVCSGARGIEHRVHDRARLDAPAPWCPRSRSRSAQRAATSAMTREPARGDASPFHPQAERRQQRKLRRAFHGGGFVFVSSVYRNTFFRVEDVHDVQVRLQRRSPRPRTVARRSGRVASRTGSAPRCAAPRTSSLAVAAGSAPHVADRIVAVPVHDAAPSPYTASRSRARGGCLTPIAFRSARTPLRRSRCDADRAPASTTRHPARASSRRSCTRSSR